MQLFSSLVRRMTGRPQNRRTPASKPAPRFRPQLEALEGRIVPSTLTVTTNADTGVGSLRTEINLAHNGDTIVFAPSMAGKTITEIYGELSISKNLTIQGLGASKLAVSGSGHRAFEVSAGANVAVSGLTVEFGRGSEGGGFLNLGTLALNGCTVRYNQAADGGGIYNAGTLTLGGCTISNNQATEGGGIYNAAGATLTISQSTLSGDSAAGMGGAIYNSGAAGAHSSGIATISGCTLSGDTGAYGGGVYNSGTATVSGCTLSGDTAALSENGSVTGPGYGGGIYNTGALTVLDSIFSGNYDYLQSGGQYLDNIYGPYTDKGGNTFS
jgi:hypothetical protein